MANIKLIIEYDGTHFKGWQIQPKGQRTVQGVISAVYFDVFKEKIKLIGSGRTDTGVHAKGQVANFNTQLNKSPDEIKRALNALLPNDVCIIDAKKVNDHFHSQYNAKSKTYCYSVLNRKERSALHFPYSLHFPHTLDIKVMREAAAGLVGTHDFSSFKGNNRVNKDGSSVRTITAISILNKKPFIHIEITADGFMYKMVRNIVGLLLEVGSGNIRKSMVTNILRSKDRTMAPYTAKACGLSLNKVRYK